MNATEAGKVYHSLKYPGEWVRHILVEKMNAKGEQKCCLCNEWVKPNSGDEFCPPEQCRTLEGLLVVYLELKAKEVDNGHEPAPEKDDEQLLSEDVG